MPVIPFSDEQLRVLVNLEQRYGVWIETERAISHLPYDLRRKQISGRSYLYEVTGRDGNGRSLGAWSPELEVRFTAYRAEKAALKTRREVSRAAVAETAALYRALRLPLLASEAGDILREADRSLLLASHLLVVGTNAMPAYAIEAGGVVRDALDETQDFDVAWTSATPVTDQAFWRVLKTVDPTFTVNTERTFQARNAKAYEVEMLVAPSRAATMALTDLPRPIPLPEQEWLLLGSPVDHVVVCRDGSPARIVAPDPRWFALQKIWMSGQAKRNPLKRDKDRRQGLALLDAVRARMPHYPLDNSFENALPEPLVGPYAIWKAREVEAHVPRW